MGNIFNLIMLLVPIVTKAVESAEQVYAGAKQGELKKNAAMEVIKSALDGIAFFKEGTKDYQNMVLMLADQLIDAVVYGYNMSGMWGKKVNIDLPAGTYELK